jgi:integrase
MGRGSIITRTTREGKKRYYTAIWVEKPDGAMRQSWKTFGLRKDAESYLDKKSEKIRQGEREPKKILFSEFAKEWLEKYSRNVGGLKDSTVYSYFRIIETYLLPFFSDCRVHKIDAAFIEGDFKPTLPASISAKTQRNILIVLRSMLRSALDWGYTNLIPFDKNDPRSCVKLPRYKREQKGRGLTEKEIEKLLNNCFDQAYPIVATAIFTGMRAGELFALKWADIDFKRLQIHVKRSIYWRRGEFWKEKDQSGFVFSKPKTKASIRSIDIGPELKKILLEHKIGSLSNPLGLVFVNSEGNPIEETNFVKRMFSPAVTAAGLGKVRFHDLRHTFGSLKIKQGENVKYVQVQMGHSGIQVTMDTYAHLLDKSNPSAAAKTEELIFGSKKKSQR